ncbi:MAG TPA: NuoF family protein [bacterium]|nr:NuoF family protein [bacterium]
MQIEDLKALAEKHKSGRKKITMRACMSAGCMSSRADVIKKNLEAAVKEQGMEADVEIRRVGCMGFCGQGPLIGVDGLSAKEKLFEFVKPEDAPAIVGSLKGGKCDVQVGNPDHPFFAKQFRIVRANGGIIDPEKIEDYIAIGGYTALHHVLTEMQPAQVVEEVTKSGLRGRGGAGFPTGLKWGTVAKSPGAKKYIICNGDEGDPGAFMDRSVLESDPHLVLEGMAIAAYAVGADQGFLYVRAEYPLAISRLQTAIKQAKQLGLLGSGIFETPFNFNVDIRIGAGAFVCGEETALMASVEGKRGTPRPRPPFPAESGLFGCPTLINNVETFANISAIINRGGEWYAGIGTEKSKGTKVFALTGKISNNGLIEVPMGIPLRQIVMEMGGGAPDGRQVKSVQTGGPSGGCIPAAYLDTPVDYESLGKLGSIMGSGGMVVMDDTTKMVEIAKFYMEFCKDESCGKCIPCRAGTAQMENLLNKIIARQATARDLAKLEELCDMVKNTSLCGLGQTAPNPVLSTLKYFRHEYEELLQPDTFGPHTNGSVKSAELTTK